MSCAECLVSSFKFLVSCAKCLVSFAECLVSCPGAINGNQGGDGPPFDSQKKAGTLQVFEILSW